ncbi:hypothetical protein ATANTOWER_027623 [Ataeniobius toweri]|uniref:Uncharacterized protein n=1 Tax=Ataeniobius toweri TaxID=208326 RepID=A0ABU7AU83_9TELE|nr:hypothetical protein [Ataeniobius toweri]
MKWGREKWCLVSITGVDRSHRHPKASLEKSGGEPQGNCPAATVQKPQEAAATNPQVPASLSGSSHGPRDPRLKGTPTPSRGPTEPGGPGPAKQPPGVSTHPSPQPQTLRTTNAPVGRDTSHWQ